MLIPQDKVQRERSGCEMWQGLNAHAWCMVDLDHILTLTHFVRRSSWTGSKALGGESTPEQRLGTSLCHLEGRRAWDQTLRGQSLSGRASVRPVSPTESPSPALTQAHIHFTHAASVPIQGYQLVTSHPQS